MDVRLPDGRVIRGVPEGTSKAELTAKLRANGLLPEEQADTAPVMASAAAAPQSADEGVRPELDNQIGPVEKSLIGIGRGFVDVGEGFAQTGLALNAMLGLSPSAGKRFDDYTREAEAERAEFEAGSMDDGVAGFGGRMAGNVAGLVLPGGILGKVMTKLAPAAVPAMTQTAGGRLALGGAAGAAEGATSFVGENDSRLMNTGVGLAAGILFGEAGFQLMRKLQGKRGVDAFSVVVDDLPASVPDAQRMQIAKDVSEGLTLDQALARAQLEQIPGVKATQGRVTQDLDQLHFEHEQLRHAGPVADLDQANRQAVFDEADRMVGQYTNTADTYDAGVAVQDALGKGKKAAHKVTGEAYDEADALAAREGKPKISMQGGQMVATPGKTVTPTKIEQTLRDEIDNFTVEEMKPVVSKLTRNGLLKTGKDGLLEVVPGARLSPAKLNSIRRTIGGVRAKGSTKALLAKVMKSLDADVVDSIGQDIYRKARRIAQSEFDAFDNRQKVRAILDGVIKPDDIVARAKSKSFAVADVKDVLGTLEKTDPQAANDLRGGILRSLVSDLKGRGDRGGVPEVNFATFRRNLDSFGRAKLEAVYGKTGARAINDFASAVGALTRVDKGVTNPGTAGTLAKLWKATKGIGGRIGERVPIGQWLLGAHRAVKAANLDANQKRRALQAIDVEILKRAQLERALNQAVDPIVPVASGAAGAGASEGP